MLFLGKKKLLEKIAKLEARVIDLANENKLMDDEVASIKIQSDRKDIKITTLEARIIELAKENKLMDNEIANAKIQSDRKDKKIATLVKEKELILNSNCNLEASLRNRSNVELELCSLKNDMNIARQKNIELELRNKSLETDINKYSNLLNALSIEDEAIDKNQLNNLDISDVENLSKVTLIDKIIKCNLILKEKINQIKLKNNELIELKKRYDQDVSSLGQIITNAREKHKQISENWQSIIKSEQSAHSLTIINLKKTQGELNRLAIANENYRKHIESMRFLFSSSVTNLDNVIVSLDNVDQDKLGDENQINESIQFGQLNNDVQESSIVDALTMLKIDMNKKARECHFEIREINDLLMFNPIGAHCHVWLELTHSASDDTFLVHYHRDQNYNGKSVSQEWVAWFLSSHCEEAKEMVDRVTKSKQLVQNQPNHSRLEHYSNYTYDTERKIAIANRLLNLTKCDACGRPIEYCICGN